MITPSSQPNPAAHLAISHVPAAYCRAVDGGDRDALLSCFWDDAIDEHSVAASTSGHPNELADWLEAKMRDSEWRTQHRRALKEWATPSRIEATSAIGEPGQRKKD